MLNTSSLVPGQILEILALSEDATAIYTQDDIIIEFANDAMLNFWGRGRDIFGLPLGEAVPELKGQPFLDILSEVWRTGKSVAGKEMPGTTMMDGKLVTLFYDFHYRAILNPDGSTLCILHTASDSTDRVVSRNALEAGAAREQELNSRLTVTNEKLLNTNTELSSINEALLHSFTKLQTLNRDLEASEQRFRTLINLAPVAICILREPEMYVETANQAMLALLGKTSDIIGNTFRQGVPELEEQGFFASLDTVYSSGVAYHASESEVWLMIDGKRVMGYYNYNYQPILDEQGKPNAIMVVAHNVTEQVNARKELQAAEESLRLATESAELGTWNYHPSNWELETSARFREMFGFDVHYPVTLAELVPLTQEDFREMVTEKVVAAIEHYDKLALEFPINRLDNGQLRWIRLVGKHQHDKNHAAGHLTGIILDITEQKADEIRKNDFIAMVSHELKTPLTSLKGYIQLLLDKDGDVSGEFLAFALSKVDMQAQKMTSLINGFLNISRLDAGKIQLNKTRFNVPGLIRSVVEEFSLFMQNNNLIVVHLCDPFEVNADEEKIGQVINNFISNAIKYGGKGNPVEIHCELDNGQVTVTVTDQGAGIAPADAERLFERYYRVETKQNKTIPGFGIGLYLCKEIIERHDGQIGVRSIQGKGSSFFFTIPV